MDEALGSVPRHRKRESPYLAVKSRQSTRKATVLYSDILVEPVESRESRVDRDLIRDQLTTK